MSHSRTMSVPAVAVLRAVASGRQYGFDIMDATNLPSGTVYPILSRFVDAGLLKCEWERATIAHRDKRPPRKYYALTTTGRDELAAALDRLREVSGRLGSEPLQPEATR